MSDQQTKRNREKTSVTLDPETKRRLLSVAGKTGGIRGLSAAISYCAQFTDDRTPAKA